MPSEGLPDPASVVRSLAKRARLHESDVSCPACGERICSPRVPQGYDEVHCAPCSIEIGLRDMVREAV